MPYIFKYHVDIHLMYAEFKQMDYRFIYIWNICMTDSDFCTTIGKLLKPKRYVTHNIIITATLRCFVFPNAVKVVLALCTVNRDSNGQMIMILFYELLNFVRVIIDSVG